MGLARNSAKARLRSDLRRVEVEFRYSSKSWVTDAISNRFSRQNSSLADAGMFSPRNGGIDFLPMALQVVSCDVSDDEVVGEL